MINTMHNPSAPILHTDDLSKMYGKYVWCENRANDGAYDGWHKVLYDKLEEVKLVGDGDFTFIEFVRVDLGDWLVYATDPDGRSINDWTQEDFEDHYDKELSQEKFLEFMLNL